MNRFSNVLMTGPVFTESFKRSYTEIEYEGWGFNWSKGQGPWHHGGFSNDIATHLIANNISVPTVVLDYPREEDLVRELKSSKYDIIGISFLTNSAIIRCGVKMVSLINELCPESKIIIGGYGALTPKIREILPPVTIHKGEGISYFRSLLGEDVSKRIKNPRVLETDKPKVFNYQLNHPYYNHQYFVPSVGCENSCPFCSGSAMFESRVYNYYNSGKEIYDELIRITAGRKERRIFITDPNFLKNHGDKLIEFRDRSIQMLDRQFCIHLFSDVESLRKMSPRFLAECGIEMIFIGFEGTEYAKRYCANKHGSLSAKEVRETLQELNKWGIQTNVSTIIIGPKHLDTYEKCRENLEEHISLNPTWSQLTPLSAQFGSPLFDEINPLKKSKKNITNERLALINMLIVPLNIPKNLRPRWKELLYNAHEDVYNKLGPSFLNYYVVKLDGYLKYRDIGSDYFQARAEMYLKEAVEGLPYILAFISGCGNACRVARSKYMNYIETFERFVRRINKSDHEEALELKTIMEKAYPGKSWYWMPRNISDAFYTPQYNRTEYNTNNTEYEMPVDI